MKIHQKLNVDDVAERVERQHKDIYNHFTKKMKKLKDITTREYGSVQLKECSILAVYKLLYKAEPRPPLLILFLSRASESSYE